MFGTSLGTIPAGVDGQAALEKVQAQLAQLPISEGAIDEATASYVRSEHMLVRFLVAHGWSSRDAAEALQEHYSWLAEKRFSSWMVAGAGLEERISDLLADPFPEEEQIKRFYPQTFHGTDKRGRPIYIERLGLLDVTMLLEGVGVPRLLDYICASSQRHVCFRLPACSVARGEVVDTSLNILDLEGLSFGTVRNRDVRAVLKDILAIQQKHYPGLTGQTIIVNAPAVFSVAWAFAKPFLSEQLLSKTAIFGSNREAYSKALLDLVDADQLPAFLGGQCICDQQDPQSCIKCVKGPWTDSDICAILQTKQLGQVMTPAGAVEAHESLLQRRSLGVSSAHEARQLTPRYEAEPASDNIEVCESLRMRLQGALSTAANNGDLQSCLKVVVGDKESGTAGAEATLQQPQSECAEQDQDALIDSRTDSISLAELATDPQPSHIEHVKATLQQAQSQGGEVQVGIGSAGQAERSEMQQVVSVSSEQEVSPGWIGQQQEQQEQERRGEDAKLEDRIGNPEAAGMSLGACQPERHKTEVKASTDRAGLTVIFDELQQRRATVGAVVTSQHLQSKIADLEACDGQAIVAKTTNVKQPPLAESETLDVCIGSTDTSKSAAETQEPLSGNSQPEVEIRNNSAESEECENKVSNPELRDIGSSPELPQCEDAEFQVNAAAAGPADMCMRRSPGANAETEVSGSSCELSQVASTTGVEQPEDDGTKLEVVLGVGQPTNETHIHAGSGAKQPLSKDAEVEAATSNSGATEAAVGQQPWSAVAILGVSTVSSRLAEVAAWLKQQREHSELETQSLSSTQKDESSCADTKDAAPTFAGYLHSALVPAANMDGRVIAARTVGGTQADDSSALGWLRPFLCFGARDRTEPASRTAPATLFKATVASDEN